MSKENPVKDFWKSIRGLVCVCGLYDCGSDNCRLVKEEKERTRLVLLDRMKRNTNE